MIEDNSNFKKAIKAEADFFNDIASLRTIDGRTPMEADRQLAAKYIPRRDERVPIVDPKMTHILEGGSTDKFINAVSKNPGGKVLDICCGSGWLALELGRRGQSVDAYDVSEKAINLAKKTLANNPLTSGFGKVSYHCKDVSKIDLGVEKYDAITGWAAFHHLPDTFDFLERAKIALKPGGFIATYDDLEMRRFEKLIELTLRFLLPQVHYSYVDKILLGAQILLKKKSIPEEIFSPMEEAKHTSVVEITEYFEKHFDIIWFNQRNAFSGVPLMTLGGKDWFRYGVGRVIVTLDRLLCALGVVRGFNQIIIAKKIN